MAATKNWDTIRGDTWNKVPTYRVKSTGVPIDLTGATVSGQVDGTVDMVCGTSVTPGQFHFGLTGTQTAALSAGIHKYSVKITFADTTVKTLLTGNLVVV